MRRLLTLTQQQQRRARKAAQQSSDTQTSGLTGSTGGLAFLFTFVSNA